MKGFTESWLAQHRARMGQVAPTDAPAQAQAPTASAVTNPFARSKAGVRSDIGPMRFRSAWEANYARYLNWLQRLGQIHRWEYETEEFWFDGIKRGTRSYRIDFKVWDAPEATPRYVEIKGFMDQQSRTRLKRMRLYYPHIRIDVVGRAEYGEIQRSVSAMIPGWEHPGK